MKSRIASQATLKVNIGRKPKAPTLRGWNYLVKLTEEKSKAKRYYTSLLNVNGLGTKQTSQVSSTAPSPVTIAEKSIIQGMSHSLVLPSGAE